MSSRILIISDTHSYLEPRLDKYIQNVDFVWHAGDIGILQEYINWKNDKKFLMVYGNIDSMEIQHEIPENQIFELEGFKILITHIAGRPSKYTKRVKSLIKEHTPNLLVCGHSHIFNIITDKEYENLLFINPGACGNEGFHQIKTAILMELENKKIISMQMIELGKRGR